MPTLLQRLARRICDLHFDGLPSEAVTTAKEAILDTVGVTLAGADADSTATVACTLNGIAGRGPALIFGSAERTDLLNAALLNGVAAHALDFDDCSNTMGGHPSAPIVPALWALADARGADGRAFIAAYVVGFECEAKLGLAVNFHHYEKGWHPTATLGTFGAAAACGHLLGLDEDRLSHALAIAASMASGMKANFGTMTKPFHVGQAARSGLFAALLAENGMTANPGALEHSQGFLAVYNGAGTFDAERIFEHWADPLDIVEPGVAVKRHPCCGSTHPALDALLQLRQLHGLTPQTVASIESWTHPRRFKHTDRADPRTGLDGKFSVQYVLARALMHGMVGLDAFAEDDINDPMTRSVMAKIRSAADPDARMDTGEHFYARVKVTTTAGEVLETFVDRPVGRDRDHPLPQGALEAKFRNCAAQTQDDASIERFVQTILALDTLDDLRTLSGILADGAGSPSRKLMPTPLARAFGN